MESPRRNTLDWSATSDIESFMRMGRSSEFANFAAHSWPRCQPSQERPELIWISVNSSTHQGATRHSHISPCHVCTVTCLLLGICVNHDEIIATQRGEVGCKPQWKKYQFLQTLWTEHPLIQHVQMRTVCQHMTLHSLITFHHANMRGSSLRICVPQTFCHPRVMSRSLPHLTLTTTTSSLSLTSPILQWSSSTHPSLLSHGPLVHCDDSRRSCGSSDLQSPTGYEPKRIELDRNLEVKHQDQTRERIMGDDYQSPTTEDVDEFGKIVVKSLSYNQSLIHSAYDSAESIADSDIEDEQLRTCFTAVNSGATRRLWFFSKTQSFRETWCNGCTEERSKCTTDTSWPLKTRELDVKFISRAQSFRETWCNVFIWQWTNSEHVLGKKPRQRTGRPVRERCSFCFEICWPVKCWEISSWR